MQQLYVADDLPHPILSFLFSLSNSWAFPVVLALFAWCTLTFARAIVGEYAKIIWFKWILPTKLQKAQTAVEKCRTDLDAEREEFKALKTSMEDLLDDNDRLLREVLYWRALHRREIAKSPKSDTEDV